MSDKVVEFIVFCAVLIFIALGVAGSALIDIAESLRILAGR